MTEAELLAHVLEAADELGVLAFHSGDSRRDLGRVGFPDVVLVGASIAFWELKSATGYPDPEQWIWLRRLASTGVNVAIVQPDWWPDQIYAALRAIRGR